MRAILCYGASNVWGFVPGSWDSQKSLAERYTKNERWTGLLQTQLGEDYNVIEEGLNGRTTKYDDTVAAKPYRNGLAQLSFCLETHYPIDVIIFMLGTNDVKIQYSKSVGEIAEGMRELAQTVKKSNKGPNGTSPRILILAPQPLIKTANLSAQFDESSIEKSIQLPSLYQKIAQEENCDFLDTSLIVKSSDIDGIHLDKSQHILLSKAVSEKVDLIFQSVAEYYNSSVF